MKNRNMLSDVIGNRRRTMFWLTVATVLCIQAIDRWPTATAFMERRRECATAFAHAVRTNAYDEGICRKDCNTTADAGAALNCEHVCVALDKYADAEDSYLQQVCTSGDSADYARAVLIRTRHHDYWFGDIEAAHKSDPSAPPP
jgi:hypothetical protein